MKDATEVLFILDKSGSMAHLTNDVIGGFNSFIADQKKIEGEIFLTVVAFNQRVDSYARRDLRSIDVIEDVFPYQATGMTALYDAVGEGIEELGKALAGIPEKERPDKVMVVIMTDGEENSSRYYNKDKISSMIEHQRSKYQWQFLFMGANIDVEKEAGAISIPKGHTKSYAPSSAGIRDAYGCASLGLSSLRKSGPPPADAAVVDHWANKLKDEISSLPVAKKG